MDGWSDGWIDDQKDDVSAGTVDIAASQVISLSAA
jgi:hypothetical protein